MSTIKPQILLTNDDGILSPGLWAAAASLSRLGFVTVTAPREQCSGMGDIGRVRSYPGIKEDVYVPFFEPRSSIKDELKLGDNNIEVTIRPPATEAHYHNAESEGLFGAVLNRLGAVPNIKIVILPMNEIKQTAWIKEKWPELIQSEKIVIPRMLWMASI